MTADELAAWLRDLDGAATDGQWFAVVNDLIGGTAIANRDVPCSQLDSRPGSPDREVGDFLARDDAALIVALRNNLPAIVAFLERLAEAEGDADAGWRWATDFVNFDHLLSETTHRYFNDLERHHAAVARRSDP